MGAWYDEYLNKIIASLRSNDSSAAKQKQQEEAAQLLNTRLLKVKDKVDRKLELLGEEVADQSKAQAEMTLALEKSNWIIAFEQYGLSDKSAEATAFFDSFIPRVLSAYDIKDANARNAALEKLNIEYQNKSIEWNIAIKNKFAKQQNQVATEEASPFATDDDQLQNFHVEEPATAQ